MCEHNLSIPNHLQAPIKIAGLLHKYSMLHDERPDRFLSGRFMGSIPLISRVPTNADQLARVLDYGFLCNFGGFAYEGTTAWGQLQELRRAVEDICIQAPSETAQAEPETCSEYFEETVKKKRDQIFRKMIDQPEEFDIWGNKISKPEPEEEPEEPVAGISLSQTDTGQTELRFHPEHNSFYLSLGDSVKHNWVCHVEDVPQLQFRGQGEEDPNGDV